MGKQSRKAAARNHLKYVHNCLLSIYNHWCLLLSARNASSRRDSREAAEDQDDPLEYAGGEFDEDEPVESVRAARDLKPAVTIRGKQVSVICLTAASGLIPSTGNVGQGF